MRNIALHYVAVIIPFVFIASIFGIKKVLDKYKFLSIINISLLLFIATILMAYLFGPLPGARNQDVYPFLLPRNETKNLSYWKNQLKDEKLIISASDTLGAHFTNRRYFYIFSKYYQRADYVILRIDDVYNHIRKDEQVEFYQQLKSDKQFQLIFKQDGLEVYQRRNTNNKIQITNE